MSETQQSQSAARRESQSAPPRGQSERPEHNRAGNGNDARNRNGRRRHNRRRGNRKPRTQFRPYTAEQLEARRAALPRITYPPQLPVSERVADIAAAIEDNQVVIISGATGSGKTTQIPKICLELGRGITGQIGHTQPRRIAARTVAERISEELQVELGGAVGYQVRFTDHVSATSLVKVMTDGILLAEIQRDPMLRRYDTIIVDEAHERSLNIDFLLGYLHRLLPQRPDLKVIVTSATIDSERFADYFGRPASAGRPAEPAPVIEVSGRTYPVEVRYRPLVADDSDDGAAGLEESPTSRSARAGTSGGGRASAGQASGKRSGENAPAIEQDLDQATGICRAADELMREGPGDILVFCSGEREIRDATDALASHLGTRYVSPGTPTSTPNAVEVLPLFARLSSAEQHRVFQPHQTRRIVIATNVAETSLTVPGIRYVIDTGTARISRYSNRTKVQRLPIEPISQASANQRTGRCGRVADGICIRLYSQADFESRPEFTEPEILRTSLASVILQMAAAGLGDIARFDFLDAPDSRAIKAGTQLLTELGAVDDDARLTKTGKALAKLPIDPRMGRMIIEASRLGCLREVMIIVAALSVQDVRERPAEHQQAADEKHARFADPNSDFLALLNLWNYLKDSQHELSGSAFRRRCKAEFLHYLRIREWQDVHAQLRQMSKQLGMQPPQHEGRKGDARRADSIHQALLSGLLSHMGYWDERKREYTGARGTKFVIFPGSHLAKKKPEWVMAAELVETSRLFARTVARIKPEWAEPLAEHVAKRTYSEPYWSTKKAAAMVKEKVLLYGLPIVAARPVPLGRIDAELAREMFISHALVDGEWRSHHKFVAHNAEMLAEAAEAQARERRNDLLIDEQGIFDFYDERIPAHVTSARHFDSWWKKARGEQPRLLDFTEELLLPRAEELDPDAFPQVWRQGDLTLPLSYEFSPGSEADGVTVHIPIAVLAQVRPDGFDWMVPGLLEELAVATIRALPKPLRRELVPAPDTARQIVARLPAWSEVAQGDRSGDASFLQAFAAAAAELRDVRIEPEDVDVTRLPAHLRMGFEVQDDAGRVLGRSRELAVLQRRLAAQSEAAVRTAVRSALEEAAARSDDDGAGASSASGSAGAGSVAGRGAPGGNAQRGGGSGGGSAGPAGRWGGSGDASGGGPGGGITSPGIAEIDGLTDWPEMAEIPRSVSSTGPGGLEVRGYPALVAEGKTVGLRVLTGAAQQAVEHRAGVAQLLTARLRLATSRVTSRWSGTQSLTLAASPYKNTEALVADLQVAATASLVSGEDLATVRTRARFEELVTGLRDSFEDEVQRLAELTARILSASRELDGAIKNATSMALLNVLTDVRHQHSNLVYEGFLTATPPEQLAHLPRYLRGAVVRLEKAEANPHRDTELAWQAGQLEEEWRSAMEATEHDPVRRARLAPIGWQLEELRVSFFAQQLGTAHSVSAKRIRKALAEA